MSTRKAVKDKNGDWHTLETRKINEWGNEVISYPPGSLKLWDGLKAKNETEWVNVSIFVDEEKKPEAQEETAEQAEETPEKLEDSIPF